MEILVALCIAITGIQLVNSNIAAENLTELIKRSESLANINIDLVKKLEKLQGEYNVLHLMYQHAYEALVLDGNHTFKSADNKVSEEVKTDEQ